MPRAGSSTLPGVLKRYQACHRCRKRKLKCDGSDPCLHCRKSHEQALKVYPLNAPSEPSCVYDSPDLKVLGPKARIAALESEIGDEFYARSFILGTMGLPCRTLDPNVAELRDLLRAANDRLAQCTCGAVHIPYAQAFTETSSSSSPLRSASGLQPPEGTIESEVEHNFPSPALPNSGQFLPTPLLTLDPPSTHLLDPNEEVPHHGYPGLLEVTLNIWPLNIPPPATLFHLVEIFFSSVPLASRLIHKPTFISNLRQVPTSPDFPHAALLHAICAMASIYSPVITQPPRKSPQSIRRVDPLASAIVYRPNEPPGPQERPYFPRRVEDVLDPVPEGFGAMHARWATESVKPSARIGDRGLQLLQAAIIICWYHYSTAHLVPLYTWLGLMMRFSIPRGLNVAEGFEPLSRLPREMLYVPERPKTPVEGETWRNTFWITYVTERIYAPGIVWPLTMHEDDISQLMPCRFSDFLSGASVPLQGRQHLFTDNMLLHHPSLTTDSWTLYIKATALVSKVRFFNARYHIQCKVRRSDPTIAPTQTEEFQSLDRTISAFLQSIPRAFRQPVGATVGALLYTAHLLPHVAMIQLHDPHARLLIPDDYSATQLLSSAREILDLIHKISATSFDILYLDPTCGFCWFLAGTTLTRFLRVKIDAKDEEEVSVLTQELIVIKSILAKLGERTAMGVRHMALLDEFYDQLVQRRDQTASKVHGVAAHQDRH